MKFRFVTFAETRDLAATHPQLQSHLQSVPSRSDLEQHPHITEGFPVFCYMLDGDKIVSHFWSFPDRLFCREGEFKWAWCGNLFTDPDYRGKGVASALVKEQVSLFHSQDLAWGGVFSTPTALRIYQRLGFSVLGHAPRYVMVKNVGPLLRHHIANSLINSLADRAYGALVRGARKLLHDHDAFHRKYMIDAETIETNNPARDPDSAKYPHQYHFDDSGAMLYWKMRARNIDRLYIARDRHAASKAFYLITRCREIKNKAIFGRYKGIKLLSVMDYGRFDLNPSVSDAIVSGLMTLFFSSDADACELISSDADICRFAGRRGMMPLGAGMSYAYCLPATWRLGSESRDIHQWHLSSYRGDAFSFE
jgi:GNAT superfamily N-acetyltransferase